jgi:hypothetical protein
VEKNEKEMKNRELPLLEKTEQFKEVVTSRMTMKDLTENIKETVQKKIQIQCVIVCVTVKFICLVYFLSISKEDSSPPQLSSSPLIREGPREDVSSPTGSQVVEDDALEEVLGDNFVEEEPEGEELMDEALFEKYSHSFILFFFFFVMFSYITIHFVNVDDFVVSSL